MRMPPRGSVMTNPAPSMYRRVSQTGYGSYTPMTMAPTSAAGSPRRMSGIPNTSLPLSAQLATQLLSRTADPSVRAQVERIQNDAVKPEDAKVQSLLGQVQTTLTGALQVAELNQITQQLAGMRPSTSMMS
jgi:hypothetical protein